eukprot:8403336-Pyramimonas_sp.AAC.1
MRSGDVSYGTSECQRRQSTNDNTDCGAIPSAHDNPYSLSPSAIGARYGYILSPSAIGARY